MSKLKQHQNGIRATLETYLDKSKFESTPDKDIVEEISLVSGVDLSIWKIDKFKLTANIWTVNGKFGSKEGQYWDEATNGQVKVIIDYIRIAPDNKNEFKEELLKSLLTKSVKSIKYPTNGEILSLIDIPDHHLGRLAYGKESGENYDIKIAEKRFKQAVSYFKDELTYFSKRKPIQKILFVVGNDFFNYDIAKPYPQTSNGTPQESDVRFQKMFTVGSKLITEELLSLSELAAIDVIIIPGNHDEAMAYYLGEVLNARFHNNPNINVDISPRMREYYQWGKTMLGFSHGQYESFERLFANMSFEDMKMWSKTAYKYFYTGHLHHKEVRIKLASNCKEFKFPNKPGLLTLDLNGILFDRLASLTSNDYYESSRGYIHIKAGESQLFSKKFGKIQTINYQLPLSIHSK